MHKIDYKPLSVNECWKGQRFKTDAYKRYERDVLFMLPRIKIPEPPYKLSFVFGLSNSLADIDNPVKSLSDILQKKYGFNDKSIYRLEVDKVIVPKGKEFIMWKLDSYKELKLSEINNI